MIGSPSALRSRDTCICTVLAACAGASPPHNPAANRSALTGLLALKSSIASTARGLAPPTATAPCSPCPSRGPRRRKSILLGGDSNRGAGALARNDYRPVRALTMEQHRLKLFRKRFAVSPEHV